MLAEIVESLEADPADGPTTAGGDRVMARQLTVAEVQAELPRLIDAVAAGEEIDITEDGHLVARLVPALRGHALKGKMTGVAVTVAEDEELFGAGAAWRLS